MTQILKIGGKRMIKIDARGKACPEPVMMTKAALESAPEALCVVVDNPEAGQNVSRFMKSKGYTVSLSAEGADITVEGVLSNCACTAAQAPAETPKPCSKRAVFISHKTLGGNDEQLGEVLIKAFLGTLTQLDDSERPAVVALMNEGVKLAVQGTSSAEALQDYIAKGGTVLVCGTCLKHFNLMDQLGAGTVSNMYEIVSALLGAQTLTL